MITYYILIEPVVLSAPPPRPLRPSGESCTTPQDGPKQICFDQHHLGLKNYLDPYH